MIAKLMLLTCLCSLGASIVRADVAAPARHQLAQRYQERHAATARKDLDGVLDFFSPSFVYVYQDGRRQNYAHTRRKLIDLFTYARTVRAENTIENLVVSGEQATVRVRNHVVVTFIPNRPVIQQHLLQAASLNLYGCHSPVLAPIPVLAFSALSGGETP